MSFEINQNEKKIGNYLYNFKTGLLGKGSYATVYKGINCENKKEVAIKVLNKKKLDVSSENFFFEINF